MPITNEELKAAIFEVAKNEPPSWEILAVRYEADERQARGLLASIQTELLCALNTQISKRAPNLFGAIKIALAEEKISIKDSWQYKNIATAANSAKHTFHQVKEAAAPSISLSPAPETGDESSSSSSQPTPPPDPAELCQAGMECEKQQDFAGAKNLYEQAAARGNARAQANLAQFYLHGLGGCPIDPLRANQLLQQAAEAKFPRAMYNLACQLETGDGVPINQISASFWYQRSAETGYKKAQARCTELNISWMQTKP